MNIISSESEQNEKKLTQTRERQNVKELNFVTNVKRFFYKSKFFLHRCTSGPP